MLKLCFGKYSAAITTFLVVCTLALSLPLSGPNRRLSVQNAIGQRINPGSFPALGAAPIWRSLPPCPGLICKKSALFLDCRQLFD